MRIVAMSFSQRVPSTTWETIPLPTRPPVVLWGWFKPAPADNSVVLLLPLELWTSGLPAEQLTLRLLAEATGVESLIGWTLFGQMIPLNEQTESWLDAQLPSPQPGGDQQLILWTQPVNAPSIAAGSFDSPSRKVGVPASDQPPSALGDLAPGEDPAPYFEMIEFFWTNILYLESDIRRARSQLDHSLARLQSLNRDLTFDELYAADSADKQQWQDARRWLRDAAASLSRSIKEIDVGLLSSAGQRNRFLDLYEQFVKPRIMFPGLKQAVVDFEMHHKSAKNVLQGAQAALHKGSAEGERRANAVLQRIHQKGRQKSNQARGKNA
jgi:hypothetical protein